MVSLHIQKKMLYRLPIDLKSGGKHVFEWEIFSLQTDCEQNMIPYCFLQSTFKKKARHSLISDFKVLPKPTLTVTFLRVH